MTLCIARTWKTAIQSFSRLVVVHDNKLPQIRWTYYCNSTGIRCTYGDNQPEKLCIQTFWGWLTILVRMCNWNSQSIELFVKFKFRARCSLAVFSACTKKLLSSNLKTSVLLIVRNFKIAWRMRACAFKNLTGLFHGNGFAALKC